MEWHATISENIESHGTWEYMVWFGQIHYTGTVLYGMMWLWYGILCYVMLWYGIVWCGVVWHGVVWCRMVWHGMVWYNVVSYQVCVFFKSCGGWEKWSLPSNLPHIHGTGIILVKHIPGAGTMYTWKCWWWYLEVLVRFWWGVYTWYLHVICFTTVIMTWCDTLL